MSKKVAVILINWNSYDLTRDTLNSFRKVTYPDLDIIVVDNGSTDDSVEYMRKAYDKELSSQKIRLVIAKENLGFAGGNNLGVKAAKGRLMCLVNNDTKVEPTWLGTLVETLKRKTFNGKKILTVARTAMVSLPAEAGAEASRLLADPSLLPRISPANATMESQGVFFRKPPARAAL